MWDRNHQMHMILRHMSLHDLNVMLPADVSYQVSHSYRHISRQSRSSILRYPHQMQMDFKDRMRAASIFRHPSRLSSGALAEAVT